MKLAKFYPKDFSVTELRRLSYQLGKFIIDVRGDERFRKVKNIAELSVLLVETHTRICVQAFEISVVATSCNSKCRKGIFSFEFCKRRS